MPVAIMQDSFEARYTLPVIETIEDTAEEIRRKQERVRALCAERNAILLAHHYQRPEVQEVADAVADSLKLSQAAAKTNADVIVFCGVHFMAETAAILLPEKIVLLPDLRAGCSLAASITPEELRKWKAKLPDAVVVVLHQHVRRGESRERLLLHVGERREGGRARFPPTGRFSFCRTNFLRRWSRGRPGAATSSRIRAIATSTRRFVPSRWSRSWTSIPISSCCCIPNAAA